MSPGDVPLGFYGQIVVGPDGSFYLSAASGGRYRAVPHRVMAFDSSGLFRAGRGPRSESTGVAFLLGTFDDQVHVISRWLSGDEAADAPWSLYHLSARDLTVRAETRDVWPGMLIGDEIVASGLGAKDLGRTPGLCIHVHGLDGSLRRSFGKCPEIAGPALNSVESGSDGRLVYWVHSNEGVVHVATLAGEDAPSFGKPPANFVTYAGALASERVAAGPDAPVPSRNELIDRITRVTRVLPVGNSLIVTYLLPPKDEARFWEYGSIVQVYDLSSTTLRAEFDTPLRLLGSDGDGRTYWMSSVTRREDEMHHAIVRARLIQ